MLIIDVRRSHPKIHQGGIAMQHNEEAFQGVGGLSLLSQSWQPLGNKKAVVVILHGVAEHSRRYRNLVTGLVSTGYTICTYDQRGHGHSQGQRGFIRSWDEYRGDLSAYLNVVRKYEPHLPIFIFGHSMGALIGLDYVIHKVDDIEGLILSATPIDSSKAASPALIAIARIMSRIWPTCTLKTPLNFSHLSRDSQVVQAYIDDPTVFKIMTVRWGSEYLDTQKRVIEKASTVHLPILIIHGGNDQICDPDGSHILYERINSADKSLKIYPNFYHECHNEPGHEQVIQDISTWLEKHVHSESPD
jgi:alpha-beta hydrolase superfamily lysophospholipase